MNDLLAVPLRAVGGFFELGADVAKAAVRRPFQWREFIDQSWFVARVSIVPTLLVVKPVTRSTVTVSQKNPATTGR